MSMATMHSNGLQIVQANYALPAHAEAVVMMLDAYARDPAAGSTPLSEFTKANLIQALAARPQAYSVLAFDGDQPVGLVNCIEGFSSFACKPLVNIHDVAVLVSHRGHGIAKRMLVLAEQIAMQRGAVKMTLEVFTGNHKALALYERLGFEGFALNPAMGTASFMHKALPKA